MDPDDLSHLPTDTVITLALNAAPGPHRQAIVAELRRREAAPKGDYVMTRTTLHTLTGLTWRTSPKDKRDPAASRHVAQVGDFLVTVADYLRADDTLDLDVRLARVDFPFTEPPAVPIIGVAYADLAGAIGDALARCVVAALQGEWLDEPADLHNLDLPDAIRADYHAALREDAGSAKVRAERHAALFGAIVDGLTP